MYTVTIEGKYNLNQANAEAELWFELDLVEPVEYCYFPEVLGLSTGLLIHASGKSTRVRKTDSLETARKRLEEQL